MQKDKKIKIEGTEEERKTKFLEYKKNDEELEKIIEDIRKRISEITSKYYNQADELQKKIKELFNERDKRIEKIEFETDYENLKKKYEIIHNKYKQMKDICVGCGIECYLSFPKADILGFRYCQNCKKKFCDCGIRVEQPYIFFKVSLCDDPTKCYIKRLCNPNCKEIKESDKILTTIDAISDLYKPGSKGAQLAQKSFEESAGIKSLDEE
jgi:ElaB/YqjD/DUF883 family membrane-anchored ribosome-binding protein